MKRQQLLFLIAVHIMLLGTGCGGSGGSNNSNPPASTITDTDSDGVADASDNCPNDANANQTDSDLNGEGDACDALPTTYVFENSNSESTVSYTGQTARQVLVSDLVDAMNALTRDAANIPPTVNIVADLNFYYSLDPTIRDSSYTPLFDLPNGENIIVNNVDAAATMIVPGAIASGKHISSKIAGQDKAEHILGGEFFGWPGFTTPAALIDEFFRLLGEEAADTSDAIAIPSSPGGIANIGAATVTEEGLDLRQLLQKLILGALTFSQGTADYLDIDYGSNANLTLATGKTYTEGAHDFDEAFGYFGAARNYNHQTDATIKSPSYEDSVVVDGNIDLRNEFNFGNATNCAKRDIGSANNTNPTDFTKEVFDAFLLGRQILQNAAANATESSPGSLSTEAAAALQTQITIAAQTWEKCIAATVIHYINDVESDMGDFLNDNFANIENFLNLAKHWGEMKGFALGLQFSPRSPFRTGAVMVNGNSQTVSVDIDDLKTVLSSMGTAPVLANGTQNGTLYNGATTAPAAKAAYLADLAAAKTILQNAYAFDAENVTNW